ncbi:hypothetical protein PPL_00263 [Heterostelium album PN500]|uniref:Uncharacterized protein n=1 Tax=Heterostelium pallidum (strain ATCC 26659 / Pp 5 / PN500) TaxID=670386 RepID=D3AVZ7_HETP5|nr:hypothetical protein PPL_00263 [Heterostelium album PN500]EFA86470.1 hypothetical protein PPL_00263 [Heterostelium album PN500]|eukprot:XP_020438575.1 hypothetical protein PPL_00263 [Heterostelium album PN500]
MNKTFLVLFLVMLTISVVVSNENNINWDGAGQEAARRQAENNRANAQAANAAAAREAQRRAAAGSKYNDANHI